MHFVGCHPAGAPCFAQRVQRHVQRDLVAVIGNPPYNANQLNENENNKNREYPEIDKRIKETYIAASNAQKTKLYDMYARFFRWASDRLDLNGILAFVSNRSFIDMRTFDGFRESVGKEFNEIYIVDLGGDVRTNPKLSGTKHNVFGIQIGVAISFLVRRAKTKGCRIFYARRPEFETSEEKLVFLQNKSVSALHFDEIEPSKRHDWLNLTDNDFDNLLPVASKASKLSSNRNKERTIFSLFSLGVVTARDEWVYDERPNLLGQKVQEFIQQYEYERKRWAASAKSTKTGDFVSRSIKWTSELERYMAAGRSLQFNTARIRPCLYRPFNKRLTYYDSVVTHRLYQQNHIFPVDADWNNRVIVYTQPGSQKPFMVGASDSLVDLHFVGAAAGSECLPFFVYDESGQRRENITDWATEQFKKRYSQGSRKKDRAIPKEAVFHYVYAVFHDPVYREKYALNLKREFPRIPFYKDFWQWADWGQALMNMHIGYEGVEPAKLKRTDVADEKAVKAGQAPKAMLKADKEGGRIVVDSETTLSGVPPEAWEYRLGNRSGLEWVLDQYKESKPKDPTIREKFDTYRFADYKEKVIDLLARVTTVSVETQKIVEAMRKAPR